MFFDGAVMTLRVAESDEKYKRRLFFEGAVMTLRVAEGDEKHKRRVFFDGALGIGKTGGQIGNLPHQPCHKVSAARDAPEATVRRSSRRLFGAAKT